MIDIVKQPIFFNLAKIVSVCVLITLLLSRVPTVSAQTTPSVTPSPSSGSSSPISGPIPPLTLKVRLKPGIKDTYVINQATAQLIGASGGSTNSTDLSGIVGWAQKINDALTPGYDYGTGLTWYDKMMADICNGGYCAFKAISTGPDNLYWCTFTVIDSFNLAGKRGLSENEDLAVINMVAFWKTVSGYHYLDYAADHHVLQQVQPGYPIFFAHDLTQTTNHEHTGIVKQITLDANGNGSIITLESNSTRKSGTYPIDNWVVQNVPVADDGIPFDLQGFGG